MRKIFHLNTKVSSQKLKKYRLIQLDFFKLVKSEILIISRGLGFGLGCDWGWGLTGIGFNSGKSSFGGTCTGGRSCTACDSGRLTISKTCTDFFGLKKSTNTKKTSTTKAAACNTSEVTKGEFFGRRMTILIDLGVETDF